MLAPFPINHTSFYNPFFLNESLSTIYDSRILHGVFSYFMAYIFASIMSVLYDEIYKHIKSYRNSTS